MHVQYENITSLEANRTSLRGAASELHCVTLGQQWKDSLIDEMERFFVHLSRST